MQDCRDSKKQESKEKAVKAARECVIDLKKRNTCLSAEGLELLFEKGRSYNAWLDRKVDPGLIEELYGLSRMAPTSMNCLPARFVFVTTPEGKQKLKPAVAPGNLDKVLTAPVIAIIGYDLAFYKHLPRLFPHRDMQEMFSGKTDLVHATAFRNSTIQGIWMMMAARALGLDCGPMSGFNNTLVDEIFFSGTDIRSNFLCCLGYGDPEGIFERLPRFEFEEVCWFA